MDPRASSGFCFMMVCLLWTARASSHEKRSCPCPGIPQMPETEPPPENCFKINMTFRYKCTDGYVRKVGTSNLIRCKPDNGYAHWVPNPPTLKCISDPSRPTAAPPLSSETKGHTYLPQDSTISTTDTSSSLQMTRTSSPSASETAEPTLTDYIRGNVDALTQWTTTSTTEPPNNVHPLVLQSTTSRLVIGCASLVIVCALMGISFFCYRRRSNETPPQAADEQIPMNPAACEELS
ncbi:interleukin-15 receptor subunit alpha isoform X2 [Cottoperca gobio]|uniref:Interleukin-15 receptor subunit alpha isoform X2 n=1 Tax=Cottoperca gobio TaxID=56716 RepID=A0A6J2S7Q9_COTGO|nr:uncharacterized protein LOC115028379 isoform X2 [Cottoperca gobio]